MQPYEQRYKPWRYLQQAVEVDRIDAVVLAEELAEIYSTPTPRGGRSRKSNWLVFDRLDDLFTIVGVWYLYLEPKHETYLITILYKPRYKGNIPTLR